MQLCRHLTFVELLYQLLHNYTMCGPIKYTCMLFCVAVVIYDDNSLMNYFMTVFNP